MRIIKSSNPGAVLSKMLYSHHTQEEDPLLFEQSRVVNERLREVIDEELYSQIQYIADEYYSDRIYEEAEELLEDVEDRRVEMKVERITEKSKSISKKGADIINSFPTIQSLKSEGRIIGFRYNDDSKPTYVPDTYRSIMNGYCDEDNECTFYGGLEMEYELSKSEVFNIIENIDDILKGVRKGKDITNIGVKDEL